MLERGDCALGAIVANNNIINSRLLSVILYVSKNIGERILSSTNVEFQRRPEIFDGGHSINFDFELRAYIDIQAVLFSELPD